MRKTVISLVGFALVLALGNVSLGQILQSTSFYFPQVADGIAGSDWVRTQVIVINSSSSTANLQAAMFDDSGAPLVLTFKDLQTGNMITDSRFNYTLPGKQMAVLETPGNQSNLKVGWMRIVSDIAIAGTSAFSFSSGSGQLRTTVGVGASSSLRSMASPVIYNRGQGLSTGIALVNITNRSDDLIVVLVDAFGREVERKTLRMLAGTHTAWFVNEFFDTIRGSDRFDGTMYFTAPNSELSAITLFFNGDKWSSFPVVQLQGGTLKQPQTGLPCKK